MGQCKMCERKGFFLSISSNGLCKSCDAKIGFEVQQQLRIINDSIKLVSKSKNMKTRLSRCDLILEHVQKLLKYEQKGIKTINPPHCNS